MVIGPKNLVNPQILLMKATKGLVDEQLGHNGYSPIVIKKGVWNKGYVKFPFNFNKGFANKEQMEIIMHITTRNLQINKWI